MDKTTNCTVRLSAKQPERVMNYVEIGKAEGAEVRGAAQKNAGAPDYSRAHCFKMSQKCAFSRRNLGPVIASLLRWDDAPVWLTIAITGLARLLVKRCWPCISVINALDSGLVFVNTLSAWRHPANAGWIRKIERDGMNFGLEALDNCQLKALYINYSGKIFFLQYSKNGHLALNCV